MMEHQIFNIIFSIVLLPVNFYCAFWLFQEAMNLTGITFREFLEVTASERLIPETGRHHFRKRRRFLIRFFNEHSSDPQRSIWLLWAFGICTLPGLAALTLAGYAAMHPDKTLPVLTGNLILTALNIALIVGKDRYRRKHPLDAAISETLHTKRKKEKAQSRQSRFKSIVVYALTGIFFFGIFFFGIFLFFITGMSGIAPTQHGKPVAEVHAELITLLEEKGYETENIPTTYWNIDESKLLYTAAGIKGSSKVEFYGYTDAESVDLTYNRIVYLTAPEMENAERESCETVLSDKSKRFTAVIGGVHHLVMYRNDTVICAYSSGSLTEINDILTGIGYLEKRP